MKVVVSHRLGTFEIDMGEPLDISLPLCDGSQNPLAWGLEAPQIKPYQKGDFIGAVAKGASVNFNSITFNPHAHGTHTECVGHIRREADSVNEIFPLPLLVTQLVSIRPEANGNDLFITKRQLTNVLSDKEPEAIVIRTIPNAEDKKKKRYTDTNPAFLEEAAAAYLADLGVDHLLIDLPSVDQEKDEGVLAAHKAFWKSEGQIRHWATITEMVYVPDSIPDGSYLMDLQTAPMVNDATPSRPVLYKIIEK